MSKHQSPHSKTRGPRSPRIEPISEPAPARRVLMLEDDLALAGLLKCALEEEGFEVCHVEDGVDGLRKILSSSFELVLCDIALPTFPGDMFYRAVERVSPELCRKFLFMTGRSGDPRINDFVRNIRGLLICKPFQIQELLEAIALVLKRAAHTLPKAKPSVLQRAHVGQATTSASA